MLYNVYQSRVGLQIDVSVARLSTVSERLETKQEKRLNVIHAD